MAARAAAVLVLVILCQEIFAAELCFEEAVPAAQRKNVTVDEVSMPLGISVGEWESGILVGEIYSIIASEILGFNVEKFLTSTSRSHLFLLSGCDGESDVDSDLPSHVCALPRTRHVAIEDWYYQTESEKKWMSFVPYPPTSMGHVKYLGSDGLFILGKSHRLGLRDGLALEYFRSYNKSWFDLAPYIPSVSEVDMNRLEFCTILEKIPEIMSAYVAATNDTDSVEMVFDPAINASKLLFKCYKEKWWVAPACRPNPETCLAMITKKSWGLMKFSQRAYFYNMPVAVANAKEENNEYVRLNRELQGLMYWWSPDSSFALENSLPVQFPPHSPSEFDNSVYKTMDAPKPLGKMVAAGLENNAPDATYVVGKFKLEDEQLATLLMELASEKTATSSSSLFRRVACNFLKKNEDTWRTWIPNATLCSRGSGLVDHQGRYLQQDALPGHAVACKFCPLGRSSVPWARSSICQPCPKGFFQDLPNAVECLPCPQGFKSSQEGQTKCTACPLGSYANVTGMSQCIPCGRDDQESLFTTTRLVQTKEGLERIRIQGASSEDHCQCKDGYVLEEKRCLVCPVGASCSDSGNLTIKPGFWSSPEDRVSVWKCYSKPHACCGGAPGSCALGRINAPGCSSCEPGWRELPVWNPAWGECKACGAGDYLLNILPLACGVAIALLMYGLAVKSRKGQNDAGSLVLAAINLSTLLWSVQVLLDAVYDQPLQAADMDDLLLTFKCLGGSAPVRRFLFRASRLVLGLVSLVPIIHLIYAIPRSKVFHLDHFTNTAGNAFLAFGCNMMSSSLLPFLCLPHPNGLFTVQAFNDVQCGDNSTYRTLVVFGLVLSLVPMGFVSVCFWLLFRALPRRVLQGDMRFVRCCNFLLSNFRPGHEKAVALLLCRGIVAALVPLEPTTAGKVVTMNVLLLGSLFVIALGQPWRSSLCNTLDLLLLSGMLILLDLGSYLIPELEIRTMVTVCMVTACLMVLATIGTVIFSLLRFFVLSNKPYRIYMSYHHATTGCYARMLKMLLDRRGAKSFLEDDAPMAMSLQELLQIVSSDTETLVFLGSREALGQRTCVGELVTARVHGIHTVLLSFPSFTEPSEIFIADSAKIIPGVVDLVSLRISLQDIAETFRWIGQLPTLRLAEVMTYDSVSQVMDFLMSSKGGEPQAGEQESAVMDCLILADLENLEAAAAAMVLQGLMAPLLQHHAEAVSVLFEKTVPKDVMYVLLVCSDMCFETARFANWLLQLRALNGAQVAILPIIAESGFRFPSLTFHSELLRLPQLKSFDLGSYAKIIRALFGELWFFVAFTPQSSGSKELHLRAEQAHDLLMAARPLAERLAAVEAETKVQYEDEDTQKAVSSYGAKSGSGSITSRTSRNGLDMAFMADIYQQYFNPTVTARL